MTVQHADLFHCLACGRVAYQPHGGPAPDCCGQPMVCAVADVLKEVPAETAKDSAKDSDRGDVAEHALFAEVVELSQWCHGIVDVDIARSEELANRLSVLHQALSDRFDDFSQSEGPDRPQLEGESARIVGDRLRDQGRRLLIGFTRFVAQLRSGPSPFDGWGQICDRIDELVAEFRQYVEIESELLRPSSSGPSDSGR
jgi:hypothetical protein